MSGKQLLTTPEAAAELRLSARTLSQWRWLGQGPRFRKLGFTVRYHPDDIAEFVRQGARSSTSDTGPSRSGDVHAA